MGCTKNGATHVFAPVVRRELMRASPGHQHAGDRRKQPRRSPAWHQSVLLARPKHSPGAPRTDMLCRTVLRGSKKRNVSQHRMQAKGEAPPKKKLRFSVVWREAADLVAQYKLRL